MTSLLDRLRDLDDAELYEPGARPDHVTLTDAGAALVRAADLTIDVDAYGNAFCVEATEE